MAPRSEASKNASVPVLPGRMPTMRAPTRLTAVARSALPASVCSKNKNSSRLNTMAVATIRMVCDMTITLPKRKTSVVSGLVRNPSGPKNSRPNPERANDKCDGQWDLRPVRQARAGKEPGDGRRQERQNAVADQPVPDPMRLAAAPVMHSDDNAGGRRQGRDQINRARHAAE